jgi:dihydroorotate dehydrogenase
LKKQAQKSRFRASALRKRFDTENPQRAQFLARTILAICGRLFTLGGMGLFYEKLARRALFRLDSERAHEVGVHAMAFLGALPPLCRALEAWTRLPASRARPVEAFGLTFPNVVGLAAGFDKNAIAWQAAAAMGFGHVEIGTITGLAQPGNPKPRMFRYPAQEAVINRMGFNNQGAETVARRLARLAPPGKRRIPLGINLGKSRATPLDKAAQDYLGSFSLLADHADYVVINVSSPNTPDLRKLQEEQWPRDWRGSRPRVHAVFRSG